MEKVSTMKSESMSVAGKGILSFVLGLFAMATPQVQAQSFNLVHTFTGGTDGGNPLSGFVIGPAGNLYGTASAGGSSGIGVVFKLSQSGQQTILHNFTGGADGSTPEGSLILNAAGNLFGTTMAGGASNAGTVFKITRNGKETVLYSFAGNPDGANPVARLAIDKAGNLYGTTTAGGANGNGTIFKLVHPKVSSGKWVETVLYSFGSGTDGSVPVAGVTLDAKGNLYGTTSAGGTYGDGTVFQLTHLKSVWTENILYSFALLSDGGVPYAGLTFDQAGNLYGAASDGGGGGSDGGGTVFELTPSNGGWTFAVLYSLSGWGISGTFRDLLFDASGNMYATTHCDGANSAGTVYKLTPAGGAWTYTELYTFTGGDDGLFSFSNLVFDKQGDLYGTTNVGGANDAGVIFEIKP
jgi:uncharacterized repeat protein (TIGR03803 family)